MRKVYPHFIRLGEVHILRNIFLIYNSTESQINKVEVVKVESYSRNMKARDHRETKVHKEYKVTRLVISSSSSPWCSTALPRPCSPWPSGSGPRSPPPPSPSASSPAWPPARAPQPRCPIAPLVRIMWSVVTSSHHAWVSIHVVQQRGLMPREGGGASAHRVWIFPVRKVTAACPHVRLVRTAPENFNTLPFTLSSL